MKKLIAISILVFLLRPALGQEFRLGQQVDEVILINVNAINFGAFDFQNLAYIEQIGSSNDAQIFQENLGYQSNVIITQQIGFENNLSFEQRGNGQNALVRQLGNRNFMNVIQSGNISEYLFDQNGAGNILNAYFLNTGSSLSAGQLIQNGDSNYLDITVLGNRSIDVNQVGELNELRGVFSGNNAALRVWQDSGMVREGMSINIISIK